MSSSDDAIISKLSAKVFGIKELMKSLKRHSRTIQAEETDEDKPKATCPYLPDEIWLNIIEQFPGEEESIKLHRESHGGWNGKLIEDTLDWQYGLVSLSATCKRMCGLVNQSYTLGTLFIHQPTALFEGLALSLAKSPHSPPELMTMKNISKVIFVNNSTNRRLTTMYDSINAQPVTDETQATATHATSNCAPRTFLTTSNRILPRLTAVVLCAPLKAKTGSKFAKKQGEMWMKHWVEQGPCDYLKLPRHGLEVQLATFARDNGEATFTACRNAGESIRYRDTWPGGTGSEDDKGYADLQSISINSLEYGLASLTQYLPTCPVSGSWCISSKYSYDYNTDECTGLLEEMGQEIDDKTPGPKWAKVYLPPMTDLDTKEQQDEYLAEEQTKLNIRLIERGQKATTDDGTARIELDWQTNAPDESKWGISGDWVQTPSQS